MGARELGRIPDRPPKGAGRREVMSTPRNESVEGTMRPVRSGEIKEQQMVKREIESTDRGIDGLVYELYGLSEEEIRIVEG